MISVAKRAFGAVTADKQRPAARAAMCDRATAAACRDKTKGREEEIVGGVKGVRGGEHCITGTATSAPQDPPQRFRRRAIRL
jgi:hypothetical protein